MRANEFNRPKAMAIPKRVRRRIVTLAATLGVLLSPAALLAQVIPDFADVPYATLHARNKLDIYLPDNAPTPYPVVVWIHGGGWSGGDKSGAAGRAARLAPLGYAVVGINYRLSGDAIFPAQIHDCKGAIRWLRANAATYNFDPDRIGVWGSSAGGHLVALLGTSGGVPQLEGTVGGNTTFSSGVQAVADYFGPTDLLNMNLDVTTPPGSGIDHDAPTSPESNLIGFDDPGEGVGVLRANQDNPNPPFPEKLALIRLADPIIPVSPDDPPFYIAHGTADTSVPLAQSTKLAAALQSAGIEHTYNQVSGAGHGMPANVDTLVVAFFEDQFLNAPAAVPTIGDWGAVVLVGALIACGSMVIRRRQPALEPHKRF